MSSAKARDIIVIALAILAFLYDRIPSAVLHIVSPTLLNTTDNQTVSDDNILTTQDELGLTTAEKMGILNGVLNLPVLVLSFCCGCIISVVDARAVLASAFFAKSLASLLMAFTTNFYILLAAAFIQGTGMFTASVSIYVLIAGTFEDDVIRGRLNALGSILLSAGYSIGSYVGGVVYSSFGQTTTFLSLSCVESSMAICFVATLCIPKTEAKEDASDSSSPSKAESEHSGYVAVLKSPKILVLFLQTFLVYICTSIATSMASYWLQKTGGFTMKEAGMIFSGSNLSSIGVLVLVTIFVTTNVRRKWTIFTFVLAQAVATTFYPQVIHIVMAGFCQSFVGLGKSAIRSLVPTILVNLVDRYHIGSYGRVLTLMTLVKTSAGLSANFSSGFLLQLLGWEWLCYSLALVAATCSVLGFFYLHESEKTKNEAYLRMEDTPAAPAIKTSEGAEKSCP